jgi:flagellar motor switch/type III secretory pathway protein FliN
MEKQIDEFLNKSPVASKVKLPVKVVLHRTQLSAKELVDIKAKGEFGPVDKELCELVSGGQVIAKGKIISKKGEYYFKVKELV